MFISQDIQEKLRSNTQTVSFGLVTDCECPTYEVKLKKYWTFATWKSAGKNQDLQRESTNWIAAVK